MQKFNVMRAKDIGKEKPMWLQVGVITQFDNGNQILELNDRSETYQVFPMEKKEPQQNQAPQQDDRDYDEIPF